MLVKDLIEELNKLEKEFGINSLPIDVREKQFLQPDCVYSCCDEDENEYFVRIEA